MHSNIKIKTSISKNQWPWFIGLYVISVVGYGAIELGLHYLNGALQSLL